MWFRRQRRGYVAPTVTIALCFGLAFFATAAARRTQSAYPRLLSDVRSSTISVSTLGAFNAATNARIAALPEVERSRTYVGFNINALVGGQPDFAQAFETTGTLDGRYFDQDRFIPTSGRLARADRIDEVDVNEFGAARLGYHVGQRIDAGFYSTDQWNDPTFHLHPTSPVDRLTVTIVGVGLFPDEVVQDEADRTSRLLITPALSRRVAPYATYGLQGLVLRRGDVDVPAFLEHLSAIVPLGDIETRVTSSDVSAALAATEPLSIVVGLFGVLAGLAGVLLSCQALSRSIRAASGDRRLLVVFGATRRAVVMSSLVTASVAVLAGAVMAGLLALAASPLAPLGPVRRVEAHPGVDLDATVLVLGIALVVLTLVAWSVFAIWRDVRGAAVGPTVRHAARPSRIGLAAGSRLRPEAAIGLGFALRSGQRAGTARSPFVSAVTAIIAVVTTVTFVASLTHLLRTPASFGWNFDAAIVDGNGFDNLDVAKTTAVLGADPSVAEWSGVQFGAAAVNGKDVSLMGMTPDSAVRPPLVSGRFIAGEGEIVLGQATAASLHASIGDEVVLTADGDRRSLTVVGTAVLPTIGKTHAEHTSLGRGAIVVPALIPGADLDIFGNHHDEPLGPHAVFIRYAGGVDPGVELAHLRGAVAPLAGLAGIDVLGVQRPAEIVSSDDVGAAPSLLTAALVIGAVVSLLIALGASVRSHRRELGVLAALGFTPRQRAATVMWQASAIVVVGLVVGIPAGAIVGRALWRAFARHVQVVAGPVAPWLLGSLITGAALLLANALALGPARSAHRMNVVESLRDQ